MDTNLFGTIRLVNAVVPRMATRGQGLVIAVGSILGELGTPFSGLYNTSKAALHSYIETLSLECKPLGVKVMLVSPGSVRSNIIVVCSLFLPSTALNTNCSDVEQNQKKTFALHEQSLYKDFAVQIEKRLNSSQGPDSMPTDVFCKRIVDKALATAPPAYISLGGTAALFYWLKWLPRTVALNMIWNSMTKP
jgi:1-acylglycerone phosphate reductase